MVECTSPDGIRFFVNYDKLAICTGAQGSTFGIKGVSEHAHFLRDVRNAEAIRNRLIENWSLANVPGWTAVGGRTSCCCRVVAYKRAYCAPL